MKTMHVEPIQSAQRLAWGSFLESPDNLRARKVVVVYVQDRGFNIYQLMKQSGVVC